MFKSSVTVVAIASSTLLVSSHSFGADRLGYSLVPTDKAVFFPVDPKYPDGIKISVVSGDPEKGPAAYLLKLPKGVVPNHWHTGEYYAVLVAGAQKHWLASSADHGNDNSAGSTWVQPAGEAFAEGDECMTDSCTIFAFSPNGIGFRVAK